MVRKWISYSRARIVLFTALFVVSASSAHAVTTWTNWSAATLGTGGGGAATGTVGGVGVSYGGELDGFVINGTSNIWAPNSSFIGGTVTASPSVVADDLRLNGSFTGISTVTFSAPVENPLFAIWSLGQPGVTASFTFNETPTFQAGGPNSQFGGAAIIVVGNTVSGNEGNGVVQFTGTFSSISWTSTFENFYAFTVGVNGPVDVPEPSSLALTITGLGALAFVWRNKKRS